MFSMPVDIHPALKAGPRAPTSPLVSMSQSPDRPPEQWRQSEIDKKLEDIELNYRMRNPDGSEYWDVDVRKVYSADHEAMARLRDDPDYLESLTRSFASQTWLVDEQRLVLSVPWDGVSEINIDALIRDNRTIVISGNHTVNCIQALRDRLTGFPERAFMRSVKIYRRMPIDTALWLAAEINRIHEFHRTSRSHN